MKIIEQRYNSTYGFVCTNNLEKQAEECFGKDWEAEDDVKQIRELIEYLGITNLTVSFIEGLSEDDILVSEVESPKEPRAYLIDLHLLEGGEQHTYLTNEEFIEKAEEQGTVYSLSGFQTDYNTCGLNSVFSHSAIRFI